MTRILWQTQCLGWSLSQEISLHRPSLHPPIFLWNQNIFTLQVTSWENILFRGTWLTQAMGRILPTPSDKSMHLNERPTSYNQIRETSSKKSLGSPWWCLFWYCEALAISLFQKCIPCNLPFCNLLSPLTQYTFTLQATCENRRNYF